MVLNARAAALDPALVVPDEQTWTVWGRDPALLGAEPVFVAGSVRRILLPERVPEPLAEPLAAFLAALPSDAEPADQRLPFPGPVDPDRPHLASRETHGQGPHHDRGEHHGHGGHDAHDHDAHDHVGHDAHDHGGHGAHDHGDMMAIVGEPSADGLVMEPIRLTFGPLATPLPGGLVAEVTLDGDVVAECDVRALLSAGQAEIPDRLEPRSWETTLTAADELARGVSVPPRDRWLRIAAVERERAISHTAWLRAFARLLGWPRLIELAHDAVAALLEADERDAQALDEARHPVERLASFVEGSRWLRWRTAGLARVSLESARELGLSGPVARASGAAEDVRSNDPLYDRLGFEPIVRTQGDALARTQIRAAEAVAAVHFAAGAVDVSNASDLSAALPSAATAAVEGPRGALHAHGGHADAHLDASGQAPALAAAADAVIGAEWSAALVGLASFDLSPWKVGA